MLKIKQLHFGFNKALTVHPFNFSVQKPIFISIIGKNGSGKTTLLKTIAGLLKPIKGQIIINGLNLNKISIQQRSNLISMVMANLPEFIPLTVHELISLNPYNITLDLHSAINLTQIHDLLQKNYTTLSHGQKQRVMIARAIAQNTKIMLLDEPENHLDFSQSLKIFKALKKLSTQKIIIISSHNLHNIITFSDLIWLITPQNILQFTPSQLLSSNILQNHFQIPQKFIENLKLI